MGKDLLGNIELNRIYQMDCLEGMKLIPDKSVDMILCDLPYGQTRLSWDSKLPLDKLWYEYKRIIKDNGAIVLTAQQPFTSMLITSNLGMFKYELIWQKTRSPSFAHAKFKPMSLHENIIVFSKSASTYTKDESKRMKYYPQMEEGEEYTISKKATGRVAGNATIQNHENWEGKTNSGRYPKSIRVVSNPSKGIIHPTQKPVELFEWLIKTYTIEQEIILDNCIGSGTTAVACILNNRKWIGFETEPKYIELANKRLEQIQIEDDLKAYK